MQVLLGVQARAHRKLLCSPLQSLEAGSVRGTVGSSSMAAAALYPTSPGPFPMLRTAVLSNIPHQ